MWPTAFDDNWVIPKRGAPWLRWGFGTRHSVLRNELASVKQVHGGAVLRVSAPGLAGEADALISDTPGLMLGIKTADCLPILMADMSHRVVGAVHAGWRGTAQGIVGRVIDEMKKTFETKPIDLLIAMGPAIGKCCFEVGPEVAREFAEFNPELRFATDKCKLDLNAINTWQLEKARVPLRNIMSCPRCTVCERESFWSFRREGESAGRMWSVVQITD